MGHNLKGLAYVYFESQKEVRKRMGKNSIWEDAG